MKQPAIFFDRDNTLIVSDGYLGDPAKVRLIDGAADALATARALGFATVVVSNQSGVARGLFGEADVRAVNQRLDELLQAANPLAKIDRHEFCPFHPEAVIEMYRKESNRRKPGAGMLLDAAEAMNLDLARSWMIGDAPRDIEAGRAAGCRTLLFDDPALPRSPAADADRAVAPDATVKTLAEAMAFIAAASPATPAPPVRGESVAPEAHETAESLLRVLIHETRKLHQREIHRQAEGFYDFSVTRLLAGVTQVVSLGVVLLAYFQQGNTFWAMLVMGIYLQLLTLALLFTGRPR